jgi:hypothetical protein
MVYNNRQGFNAAALRIIEALNGDPRTGKCFCPIHDDGRKPSLQVNNGNKHPVVIHCHGGGGDHDKEVMAKLREMELWPTSDRLSPDQTSNEAEQRRSEKQRLQYAVGIWNDLARCKGRPYANALKFYLNPRKIDAVPNTAMFTLPLLWQKGENKRYYQHAHSPAMVLPVRDATGKLQGIHTTWLNPDINDKREQEPQRQTYGLLSGNFVELQKLDYQNPPDTLLIGEGVETTLSAMQVTELPGIASSGWQNMVIPPQCRRYIILADNDLDGGSEKLARHLHKLFPDSVVRVAMPVKPEGGKKGFDWNDLLMDGADPADMKYAILTTSTFDVEADALIEPADEADGADGEKQKQADHLIRLAAQANLFHNIDGVGYADITRDGHRETWRIGSSGFESWLRHQYFRAANGAPNDNAMKSALAMIEAQAEFEGPEREVFLRVAHCDGRIYVDLCDKQWRVVEIDADGWRLRDDSPVRFVRRPGMRALPVPVSGGSIEALRGYVNIKTDAEFILLIAGLLAAFHDQGGYPVTNVTGEAGSAKSTFLLVMLNLIDPNKAELRVPPRDVHSLFIAASGAHILAYDNLSELKEWLSDTFSRLSTGGSFGTRMYYTDDEERLFAAKRPVLLGGIEDVVAKGDLAERVVRFELQPIPDDKRREEEEFWPAFERDRPGILGALLDAVAHGLRMLPHTKLQGRPRMADFAKWSVACGDGHLWDKGAFIKAYAVNRRRMTLNIIEADPVAAAVLKLMTETAVASPWSGRATELLEALERMVGEREAKRKDWPQSAAALGGRIRTIATPLRRHGIEIGTVRAGKRRARMIQITRVEGKVDRKVPSASSAPAASPPRKMLKNNTFSQAEGGRGGRQYAEHRTLDMRTAKAPETRCRRTTCSRCSATNGSQLSVRATTTESDRSRSYAQRSWQ